MLGRLGKNPGYAESESHGKNLGYAESESRADIGKMWLIAAFASFTWFESHVGGPARNGSRGEPRQRWESRLPWGLG